MSHKRGRDKKANEKHTVLRHYKRDRAYMIRHLLDLPVEQWFTSSDKVTINPSLQFARRHKLLSFYFRCVG